MWVTTTTINMSVLTELPNSSEIIEAIRNKKNELRNTDNLGGHSLEGFTAPDDADTIVLSENVVVKRGWGSQTSATEYADFANNQHECIVVTVEEQV